MKIVANTLIVTAFVKGKSNEIARMIAPTINTEMEGVLNFGWSRLRGEGRSFSLDIEKAIQNLVNEGLVVICTAENGLPLYSLTEDEPLHSLALELLALDWWQWQVLIEQSTK